MPANHRITIQDIAEHANVSLSTVSRVLRESARVSPQKREAVLRAVEALEYRPNVLAQGLASGETKTMGVLTQYISAQVFDTILQGVLNGLRGSGYSPLFADGSWNAEREQRALHLFLDRQVDALIVIAGASPDDFLRQLAAEVPLILVGRCVPELERQCIRFDDFEGGYRATSHLIENGHKHIAHITGILSHEDACLRRDGYQQALADAGLPVDEALIIQGDYLEPSGVLAVETLVNRGRPFSALFAANDQMAYGARLALSRRGIRVPDDVSLVGFDDQPYSAYSIPPLTTVRQPALEMGELAAQAALALVRGEPLELHTFPAKVIHRESVAWVP